MDTPYLVGNPMIPRWLLALDRKFGTAVGFERLLAWGFVMLMVILFAVTVGPYLVFG